MRSKFFDSALLLCGVFLMVAYFVWAVGSIVTGGHVPLGGWHLMLTAVVLLLFIWRLGKKIDQKPESLKQTA